MRGLLFLLGLAMAAPAHAADGLDTVRFRPAGSPSAGAFLEGVSPGAAWNLDLGAWVHFARRPVVFTDGGVPADDAVIAGRFATLLRAGYTVGERFRIGVDVPVTIYQAGVDPHTGGELAAGGLGDLRILPHIQILDPRRKWLGLAITTPITLPTGSVDALLGEGMPTIHPKVVAEKRLVSPVHSLLRFTVALEAGYHLRPPTRLLDLEAAGAFTVGLGLRWEPLDFLRVGTEGVAAIGEVENFRHGEWITWGELRVDKKRRLAVTVGASLGLGRGVGTPEGRVFAGLRATVDPRRPPAVVAAPGEPEPAAAVAAVEEPPLPGEPAGWGLRLVGRPASIDAKVLFESDSHRLRPAARTLLDAVARWFLGHRGAGVLVVEGHADPRGSLGYNDALAEHRAESVRDYLRSAGVPEDRLDVRSFGERRPSREAPGAGADRYSPDRRVVFVIEPARSASRDDAGRR